MLGVVLERLGDRAAEFQAVPQTSGFVPPGEAAALTALATRTRVDVWSFLTIGGAMLDTLANYALRGAAGPRSWSRWVRGLGSDLAADEEVRALARRLDRSVHASRNWAVAHRQPGSATGALSIDHDGIRLDGVSLPDAELTDRLRALGARLTPPAVAPDHWQLLDRLIERAGELDTSNRDELRRVVRLAGLRTVRVDQGATDLLALSRLLLA
jgi:hypothetical protein